MSSSIWDDTRDKRFSPLLEIWRLQKHQHVRIISVMLPLPA